MSNILTQPTLVLNKTWVPVNTVSVQKALTMVFGEWRDDKNKMQPKAKILDIDTWRSYSWEDWSQLVPKPQDSVIHGGNDKIYKAPEIIIATRYTRMPKNQLNFNRRNLFRRDEDSCQYCGKKYGKVNLSIDHIIPRSKGGVTSWENCVICCLKCNQKKADKLLTESNMTLIRKPTKPGLEILGNVSHKIRSWEIFFGRQVSNASEAYWQTPLE